ncbi:hypothetical protein KIN20_014202 [Parelaphostrongylus tenuis]|uniref:Uncharacterized protein n=1 Tax=Parelaphostrongylus tenuis TaxID=148309 RepID=A0AAD5QN66_PARTN|nr:hypothetical protein KIN20_014202 [Parelaphostrongylus tenuis]
MLNYAPYEEKNNGGEIMLYKPTTEKTSVVGPVNVNTDCVLVGDQFSRQHSLPVPKDWE